MRIVRPILHCCYFIAGLLSVGISIVGGSAVAVLATNYKLVDLAAKSAGQKLFGVCVAGVLFVVGYLLQKFFFAKANAFAADKPSK